MTAKEALIFDVNDGMSVTDAAEEHGVVRSCAYKWVARYRKDGWEGLAEQSRRPEYSPSKTPQDVVDELLKLKRKHPLFGPAKLSPMLDELYGEHVIAPSTAGEILARHGQVRTRRPRQRSAGPIEHPPFEVFGAGDTATTDYKGQFRMGNGAMCYPLTMGDPVSRFVMIIEAIDSTKTAPAKVAYDRSFRDYGIPRQMVSDNGSPFCSSRSLGGLTELSRWWIEMGIIPVRIELGRPDQNGIHERMHRTLKDWIRSHPCSSLRSQQRTFNEFRHEFNQIRPHEALGQKPPVTAFSAYRPYAARRAIEYDTNMIVRSVRSNGEIKWKSSTIYLSQVLIGARVGLLRVGETILSINFGPMRIGYVNEESGRATNSKPIDDTESKPGYGR